MTPAILALNREIDQTLKNERVWQQFLDVLTGHAGSAECPTMEELAMTDEENLPTEPTWWNQLTHAQELYKIDPKEVLRHAKVSTDNKHFCHDCFCCACLVIYRNKGEKA